MSVPPEVATWWVADDTEDSVVGADWHQGAIGNLYNALRTVAAAEAWPWHIGNQLTLVAWHPDGRPWRPMPDLMIHPRAGSALRAEMDACVDGLPTLIIEVSSPTTYRSDLNVAAPTPIRQEAKGYEYLAWPLPEYLVFDPSGEHLPGQVRAWRTAEGHVEEWQPDEAGRYQSRTLGVAFQPEGLFLRVYNPAGEAVLFDYEQEPRRLRAEQAERAAERARIWAEEAQERQRAEQERQRAERAEREVAELRALLERLQGERDSQDVAVATAVVTTYHVVA